MPVYLFNSPLYEWLYNDPSFYAYYEHALGEVARLGRGSDYVHIFPMAKTFPAEQMQTVDHLILPAAQAYTAWIVEQMTLYPYQLYP
jgi:hypothetical protein